MKKTSSQWCSKGTWTTMPVCRSSPKMWIEPPADSFFKTKLMEPCSLTASSFTLAAQTRSGTTRAWKLSPNSSTFPSQISTWLASLPTKSGNAQSNFKITRLPHLKWLLVRDRCPLRLISSKKHSDTNLSLSLTRLATNITETTWGSASGPTAPS